MWSEKFDVEKQLGEGQFGVVVQCVEKKTGDRVAIKLIKKSTEESRNVSWEVEALQLARGHRRLLQLLDVFETSTELAIVLELVQGGELFDYLATKDTFTEEEAVLFTRQLLHGLDYLYNRKVAHLDIKPENIVLVEEGRVDSIKLIDFGLARILNTDEPQFVECGTPEFVAPEIVRHRPVTTAADMCLSGMSPFISATDEQTLRNVAMICYELDEDFSETDVTKESLDFIQSLLVEDPSGRLTAKECLQHIWIKGPAEQRRHSIISTEQLRIFNAKRKWHSTVKAVQACLSLKGKGRLPYQDLEFQTAEMEASGSSEFSEKDTVWSVSSGNEPTTWHKSDSIPSTSKTRKLRETSTWYSQTAGIWSQVSNDSGIDLSSPQILERHLLVDHNPVGTASALLDQTPRSPLETHFEAYEHTDMLKTNHQPLRQEAPYHFHPPATVSAQNFEG